MINVYFADIGPLSDEALFASLYNRISLSRREKVSSFRFLKGKSLSLAAAILLDQGLKPYGLSEQDMEYGFGVKGKPFLAGHPEIAFSISHSEEKVMVAVSGASQSTGDPQNTAPQLGADGPQVTACQLGADGPQVTACQLGADIEKIEKADLALSKRFFADAEHETLSNMPPGLDQDNAFYRLWTLKESFIKATGMGLALPLKSFQIDLGTGTKAPSLSQSYNEKIYTLSEIDAYPGYKCSLCNEGALEDIKINYVDLRSI